MGCDSVVCDIHFYVEKRDPKTDRWVYIEGPGEYGSFYEGRNYALFGVLAGVRSDVFTPILSPQGFPDNASPELVLRYKSVTVPKFFYELWEQNWQTREEAEETSGKVSYLPIDQARNWYPDAVEGDVVRKPDWHSASWLTVSALLNYDWSKYAKNNPNCKFLYEIIPALMDLGFPHDVRCVFWFDD